MAHVPSPLCRLRGCAKVLGICLKGQLFKGSLNLQCLLGFCMLSCPVQGGSAAIVFPSVKGSYPRALGEKGGTRRGFAPRLFEQPCQRGFCLCLGLLAEVRCPTGSWWTCCARAAAGDLDSAASLLAQGAVGSLGLGTEQSRQLDIGSVL